MPRPAIPSLCGRRPADRFRRRLLNQCLRVSRLMSADPASDARARVAIRILPRSFSCNSPTSTGPPPPLVFETAELKGNVLHVSGRTEPGATLTLNGERLEVQADGTFNEFLTFTGSPGATTTTLGMDAISAIGAKSFTLSYGMFLNTLGLSAWLSLIIISV